ncbi:DUF2129 domain-containing protein [Lactobacillus iners]|uniref:DUF2129 domain-containing protein n=1 Tax=Lactobacillus iners TaxID=147802 RepID=UPI0001E5DBF0|nr:hypothetical protein HMPREF9215_0069 [Lactobacillus iners SPIN 2503V10-D]
MGLVFQDKNKVEQISDRVAIVVYLNKNYEKSFLYKFGNLIYASPKNDYAIMYISESKAKKIITMLTENKFVKSVEISKYNDLDFSSEHTSELMNNLKTTAENKLKNGEEF